MHAAPMQGALSAGKTWREDLAVRALPEHRHRNDNEDSGYAAYLLALSEAQSASGPALA